MNGDWQYALQVGASQAHYYHLITNERQHTMNGIHLTVAGNLTRDPEVTTTNNGTTIAKFSLACERSWKTPAGEWDKAVSYLDVLCWKNLADEAEKLLTKGTRVIIDGRLDQSSWEDKETGAKRTKFEFTAEEIAISLRSVESFERRQYDNADGAARKGSGGGSPAPRRAPAQQSSDDSVWG